MPAEPTPAPQPLMNLESCLTAGAMFFGTGVQWVQIGTVDGRVQRLELPTAPPVEPDDEFDEEELSEKEQEILAELGKLKPGEFLKGPTLAAAVDLTYDGGQWCTIIQRLKAKEKIESKRQRGYRLFFKGSQPSGG